jgi:mxaK protein
MRRRRAHLLFALVAVACALCAAYYGWRWTQGSRINAAIAHAQKAQSESRAPEARFAQAIEQARAGQSEAALKTYKALIQSKHRTLKHAAQYNLGNLYMRDALKNGAEEAFKSLPLIELAKQSYRDLLREDPSDWDARYNLERALWLAPEVEPPVAEEADPPEKEENVATTLQHAKIDLP